MVGDVVLKSVEHRQNVRLERIKADLTATNASELAHIKGEIDARYATLKSSIEFMTANQAELRGRLVASCERLWTCLAELREAFQDVLHVDMVLLPHELDELIKGPRKSNSVYREIERYAKPETVVENFKSAGATDAERHPDRLFAGEKLWLLFYVLRALYGRLGVLYERSIREKRYVDWRTDTGVEGLCKRVVPDAVLEGARRGLPGFQYLTGYIEVEFLKEATRVMSGSRGLLETLPDVQTSILAEKKRLAAMAEKDGD